MGSWSIARAGWSRLDPPGRLERDQGLHALALDLFRGAPRPAGPSRSQLLQALAA
jgi:hypothetical protein